MTILPSIRQMAITDDPRTLPFVILCIKCSLSTLFLVKIVKNSGEQHLLRPIFEDYTKIG